ncbi:MAG: tetratricopeptide repeat protein [Ignavibacteriales bacterium]|nr:tetratricopeptide repeat protein [Ignavibacteriales bacterium]
MSRSASPPPPTFGSVTKERIFRGVLLLIPFLFLALLEMGLRLLEYGGNLDLVVTRRVGNRDVYSINRSAAARYFSTAGTVIPEPADDVFEMVKSDSTIRIFCLGESTMAGFPYDFNATAPGFLRDRLQMRYPDRKIEIINLGLSASSSYIVLDFVEELLAYQPDLFIIYLGHNEFYGVYGAGSSVRIPGGHHLTRFTIELLNFKTYLLLRDGIAWVRQSIASPSLRPGATLMEQMVREQHIPYGSPLYGAALDAYRDNLFRIIGAAKTARVPVMFSDLVSNEKDHPPFRPVFNETTVEAVRDEWRGLFSKAESLASQRRFAEALETYRRCMQLDSLNASAVYATGLLEYDRGWYDEARTLLQRAKDLDALRFRASEDFKAALRAVCKETGTVLAETDSAFRASSPHGIIGKNLMLEHLHPNLDGYILMADVFARTILERKILPVEDTAPPATPGDSSELYRRSGATIFDETVGRIRVEILTRQWPFQSRETPFLFEPSNPLERIVYRYIDGTLFWSTARYELADYFAASRDFERARLECLAVAKVIPYSYQPLLRVADYYRMEGIIPAAAAAYRRCIAVEDNPFARFKLAILLLEGEQAREAITHLGEGLKLSSRPGMNISPEAVVTSHYLLGVAYAKLGQWALASKELEQVLSLDPHHADARSLLQQIAHSPVIR